MSSITSVALLIFVYLLAAEATSSYQLVESSSGSSFFDNWNFYNGVDTNMTGNVLYQTRGQATQLNLISASSDGNVMIKRVAKGNLLIFDAVHLPFGCSVWPAFWTHGTGNWPDSGEIDIIEGVNMQTQNSISLHTLDGYTHPDASSAPSIETGKLISTGCFNQTNGKQGCIAQALTNSYGQGFSQNGGGVYALEWTDTGPSVWFFQRSTIPSDLPTDLPNPSGWGLPTAFYPASSCDFDKFFQPQTLILDITVCGAFAIGTFTETCSGNCLDLVQNPEIYDNAYYEISYIKMFKAVDGATTGSTGVSSSESGSATKTGTGSVSVATGTASSATISFDFSSLTMLLAVVTGLLIFHQQSLRTVSV